MLQFQLPALGLPEKPEGTLALNMLLSRAKDLTQFSLITERPETSICRKVGRKEKVSRSLGRGRRVDFTSSPARPLV